MSSILHPTLKHLVNVLFLFLIFIHRVQLERLSNVVESDQDLSSSKIDYSAQNLDYEDSLIKTRISTNFLVQTPIHSPFDSPTAIEDVSAFPIAYSDFDADKYSDIFLLANNGTSIYLLKGHLCVDGRTVLTFFGSRRCLSLAKNFICQFSVPIYNLVASDFTGTLHQDLLITIESLNHQNETSYDIILVKGDSLATDFNCAKQKVLVKNASSEPFILDFNGDMISDFIVETKQCSLQLVLGGPFNENNESQFICLANISSIKHLAQPHACGFMNLNSYTIDMTPDIFINGEEKFEYIFNIPHQGFIDKKEFSFPSVPLRGQSAFVDLDCDGQLDHLIPVCLDSETFAKCQKPGLMVLDTETGKWISILNTTEPLGANFNRSLTFIDKKIHNYISLPVTLHIGDINYDGYPDFATVLLDTQTKRTVGAIFLNKLFYYSAMNRSKHIFQLDWIGEYEDDVLMVSQFDIYNNGRLNLLIVTENESTKNLRLRAYDYYIEQSLYFSFLRINIVSDLCSDKSQNNSCSNHLAFGSTPPGVSVCFYGPYDDHICSVQMGQSAHFALKLPYIIFGLGDVLNVVNDLTVSIANGNQRQRIRKWNDIIPGSKLVIIPYRPYQTSDWELRVFINMSIYSLVVLLFLLVLGLMLTCAISILHFREKVEDRVDNQQYRNAWL